MFGSLSQLFQLQGHQDLLDLVLHQSGNALKGPQTLDDQTIIERICDVLDIDYTEIEDRLPDKAEQDPYAAIDQATDTQAVNDGEVDEGASGIAQIAG